VERIVELKKQYPGAKVLAHPECKGPILQMADVIGSTAALLKYTISSTEKTFIIATESGILFEMQKNSPDKTFIPVPPESSETVGCHCNECAYMRMNTMEKLYNCLKYEWPEIMIDKQTIDAAVRPINEMLGLSAKLGL
jgi:quinolinate synthase